MLHANGVVVSHLFPAVDIGMTALSVAAAIVLGAMVLQVETKMVPTRTTVTMMNEMHHGAPSTPPSNPCPGKSKGHEGKDGSPLHGRRW